MSGEVPAFTSGTGIGRETTVDPEQLPAAILLQLICLIIALGLWYLGLRRNSSAPKQIAVAIGLLPVLAFGVQFLPLGSGPAEYRSAAVGPTLQETAASPAVPIPVTNPAVPHELVLTPKIRGGTPPDRPVHLRFMVRSPDGATLAEGASDLAPAQRLKWQPLRAQFQPRQEGEHTLILEIPQPVSSVDIIVREVKK